MKKIILFLATIGLLSQIAVAADSGAAHPGGWENYYLSPGTYSWPLDWPENPGISIYNVNSSGIYHFSGTISYDACFVISANDVTIYLENFSMSNGAMDSTYPDGFQVYGSSVEIILVGESTMACTWGRPIDVKSTGSLTISSENDGSLTLNSNNYYALQSDGTTTIDGGTVIANGSSSTVAIGGTGDFVVNDGTAVANYGTQLGNVTVNGGSVTSQGNGSNAGINADSVTVNGGTLVTTGGTSGGAGISADNVTINNGTVTANGKGSAAGINSSSIAINGGLVSANSEGGSAYSTSPSNASNETLYCVTLPDATAAVSSLFSISSVSDEIYTYTVTEPSNYSYSYSGTGLENTDDLYFYLPNGAYIITGSDAAQGRQYGGVVNGGPTTFEAVTESDIPSDTIWSDLDLDTTGQTKELLPSYPIPYSAKWAENDYDRTFALSAEEVGGAVSYSIAEFAEEEEGTYAWNYTLVPASELPRGATYKLSYVIKNDETVFDSQLSAASVTLLPEPCVALVLTFFGLAILRRK